MKTFTLPDSEGIAAAIKGAIDAPYIAEHFTPLVVEHAGTIKAREGLNLLLELAAYDFGQRQDMPIVAMAAFGLSMPAIAQAIEDASEPTNAEGSSDE